jgi:hypothetical protein
MVDQRDSRVKYFPGSWGRFGFIINSERFRESTIYSVKERGFHEALRSQPTTLNHLQAPNFLPHASAFNYDSLSAKSLPPITTNRPRAAAYP